MVKQTQGDNGSKPTTLAVPGLLLRGLLGEGAFGAVYRARHETLDIDVALKFVATEQLAGESAKEVLREARLMARLDHPNLLRILDAGVVEAGVYLVLELMDGGSCQDLKRLPVEQGVGVLREVLSGTQALHAAGILHRDIKPANFLRREADGRIKLADLGLAIERDLQRSRWELAGTAPFMAPELFSFPPRYSVQTDLYAVGMSAACVLLEDRPYPKAGLDSLRDWAMSGRRPRLVDHRPDLPVEVARTIDRMTEPRATDRPADATEALRAILSVSASMLRVRSSQQPVGSDGETNGEGDAETFDFGGAVGPWQLGPEVYRSRNWLGRVVTHTHSAKPARLMQLLPTGKLSGTTDFILASAARASRLRHAGVVGVLDWGKHDGLAYIVTDEHGRALETLVRDAGQVSELDAVIFLATLADALRGLHEAGMVYQHLDPGAAVVARDARAAELRWPVYCVQAGTAAVADDGQGRRVFAKAFAAPEIADASHGTIETSVDLFGLGATAAFLMAGEAAYQSARLKGIGETPDVTSANATVTARTSALVAAMTAPQPSDRPDAREVVDEAVAIATGIGAELPATLVSRYT